MLKVHVVKSQVQKQTHNMEHIDQAEVGHVEVCSGGNCGGIYSNS